MNFGRILRCLSASSLNQILEIELCMCVSYIALLNRWVLFVNSVRLCELVFVTDCLPNPTVVQV